MKCPKPGMGAGPKSVAEAVPGSQDRSEPAQAYRRCAAPAAQRDQKVEFPWTQEVTKCAPREAIIALGQAYQNWFNALSGKRKGPALRAPQFKKKGRTQPG